jgi:menaquinone-9 beta-reductase
MRRTPALIVGGGPAGSAAAIALARSGREVTLIERSASPSDKVCGDFLSVEAVNAIAECGVDLAAFAPAPIGHVRLIHGTRSATVRLPFAALGLTRRALDEALLRRAEDCGAIVFRGQSVRGIRTGEPSIRVDCGPLGLLESKAVFLATGKHNLRGVPRQARSRRLVGLKMYYALDPTQAAELRGHIELVLFPGGYAGLQLVEGDRAVLCALLPDGRLRSSNALADECPHLAARLSGARALLVSPLAIADLPYGYVHRGTREEPPGLFRLGDQAAVIPSLTGDGVALAMASATLAARTWLQGGSSTQYYQHLAIRLSSQMRLARGIHWMCTSQLLQPWAVVVGQAWPAAVRFVSNWTRSEIISPHSA